MCRNRVSAVPFRQGRPTPLTKRWQGRSAERDRAPTAAARPVPPDRLVRPLDPALDAGRRLPGISRSRPSMASQHGGNRRAVSFPGASSAIWRRRHHICEAAPTTGGVENSAKHPCQGVQLYGHTASLRDNVGDRRDRDVIAAAHNHHARGPVDCQLCCTHAKAGRPDSVHGRC